MSVLYEQYKNEIRPELLGGEKYTNLHEVPKLEKIVLSTGIGTDQNRDVFDECVKLYADITGQKAMITKSKKAVASFKLREDVNVGVTVTMRNKRMYDFYYRLVNIALPRVRDFRGVNPKSFDGFGNYTFGVTEQSIFTEVNLDNMKNTIGMNITFVTSASNNEDAFELLKMLGMPFAK
ncbi:MAG: 50S ribosomal protein L5 [Lentisphaeria bacterium]|nr:50S ribosomal protein L5 [Lentisphaeria bacterium]NQZ67477.1 50S ribosomal protein L5 [Lentisphaeria bacterium]